MNHSQTDTLTYIHTYIYICCSNFDTQASDFDSKGHKLSSSGEIRIRSCVAWTTFANTGEIWKACEIIIRLQGVSNHLQLDCLFNSLFRPISKTTPTFRIATPLWGESPVTCGFTSRKVGMQKAFSCEDFLNIYNLENSMWHGFEEIRHEIRAHIWHWLFK